MHQGLLPRISSTSTAACAANLQEECSLYSFWRREQTPSTGHPQRIRRCFWKLGGFPFPGKLRLIPHFSLRFPFSLFVHISCGYLHGLKGSHCFLVLELLCFCLFYGLKEAKIEPSFRVAISQLIELDLICD